MSKMGLHWGAILTILPSSTTPWARYHPPATSPSAIGRKWAKGAGGGIGQVPGFYETHAGAGAHLYVNLTIGANPFMSFLV